jgi:predicted SAM-dependent methyltransferase
VSKPKSVVGTEDNIRAVFLGEKGKPSVDSLDIAGLRFRKGEMIAVSPTQLAELRAHSQYGKFEFEFTGDSTVLARNGVELAQSEIDCLQQAWIVDIANWNTPCLHIGCGEKYIAGAVNIDHATHDSRIMPDRILDAHHLDTVFGPGSFSSAVSSHVIPSLGNPVVVFKQIAYVLRPGGIMAHVVPDLRYAPARKDKRRHDYQPWGWYGPDDFAPVLAQVADLFDVVELAEFPDFHWSFKVVARRR